MDSPNPESKSRRMKAPTAARKIAVPAAKSPNVLRNRMKPSQTPEEATSEMAVEGLAMHAVALSVFSEKLGQLDLTEACSLVTRTSRDVANGDLSAVEALLAAQVVTLNAIFTDFILRAAVNRSENSLESTECLMRMGFRAQAQCRATAESISAIQNPTVFAKQLQVNNAKGHQQINNDGGSRAREEIQPAPNEQLKAATYVEGIANVDTRAKGTTGGSDSTVATVERVNRSNVRKRQSALSP